MGANSHQWNPVYTPDLSQPQQQYRSTPVPPSYPGTGPYGYTSTVHHPSSLRHSISSQPGTDPAFDPINSAMHRLMPHSPMPHVSYHSGVDGEHHPGMSNRAAVSVPAEYSANGSSGAISFHPRAMDSVTQNSGPGPTEHAGAQGGRQHMNLFAPIQTPTPLRQSQTQPETEIPMQNLPPFHRPTAQPLAQEIRQGLHSTTPIPGPNRLPPGGNMAGRQVHHPQPSRCSAGPHQPSNMAGSDVEGTMEESMMEPGVVTTDGASHDSAMDYVLNQSPQGRRQE
ncbi:Uu.00g084180.m01.CDS01 [Anthostomella pinea]|uniref:Uu.00g084180.m01.CDS01 n=1 Tax=Anthostomella pinea TaxID=933095 RepID=A0AAI8YJQ0_9PEZI|nr:Uu.00g084180.m01.CDS01 [Anthostomella pinea]